jgi:hypothetical protein
MAVPSTSEPTRPPERSAMQLVRGEQGAVRGHSAPDSARAPAGAEQLPSPSVGARVRRKEKAAAAGAPTP